jgi:folate-dependent phosphoribosylglycinamide formyltransferase PurN
MYRIGWFSSGRDEAARQLLTAAQEAIKQGEIEGEIVFVFSNRLPGEDVESDLFFELVKSYNLPLITLSSKEFRALKGDEWRKEFDREVMKKIAGFNPDLCLLAGYMLIVGEEMCTKYPLINLHPAPPQGPAGTWQEVIWQLIENRAEISGIKMHLVTPELDQGPAVTYCIFPIQGKAFSQYWMELDRIPFQVIKQLYGESFPLFKLIRREGVRRELPLLIATIKAFARGEVRIEGTRVVDKEGKPILGYDLSREIETRCL